MEWIWAGTPCGQVIPIVSKGRAPLAITTPETGRLAATNSAMPAPFEKPITTNPSGRSATPWIALTIRSGKAHLVNVSSCLVVVVEDLPVVLINDVDLSANRFQLARKLNEARSNSKS